MLRKIKRNNDSCDARQREPLFLRVSPGGVSAISLMSYLRNGIHPQMAVPPAPLGLFLQDLQVAALRVRQFVADAFISDNLQDEYAIDIYQRTLGRGLASIFSLMEYLLIPAQRDEEIEFSTSANPLRMIHINFLMKSIFEAGKNIVWPNSLTALDAQKAISENHKKIPPNTKQVEDPNS